MSKLVDAQIRCPHCGKEYSVKLFRTIWGEHESLRLKVMNDEVNVCTCPHCNYSFKAPYPFMYVDVKAGFAVWWEPEYDAGIDEETKGYVSMFGSGSYYATAPRIADWEEFKATIQKYYSGELVGGKIEKVDASALKALAKGNNKGCMLTLLAIFAIGCTMILL